MKWFGSSIFSILFITVLTASILLFQSLLTPKYMNDTYEGAMVSEYYSEQLPHDVIFAGDCEVYSTYSTITLWEKYGITSYIRGGPQQLIWQSYYMLEDTFKHEIPKAVVVNVLSMQYADPVSEGYNRLNLDGLPLSITKLNAVNASKMDEESVFSYIVPIARWHSRWSVLTASDFKYMFTRKKVTHNGYLLRSDVKPAGALPSKRALPDYTFSSVCYGYLDKITRLCQDNGVSLILVKSPAVYPYWYDEWDEQISSYAASNGLNFYNLLARSDEIGMDMNADTFDAGIHLNVYGAEKTASYFGSILAGEYGLADHRSEPAVRAAWEQKSQAYYAMKSAQEAEIKEFGKVLTHTY